MTTNEVAYWSLQEQKRSNLAREAETKRSNLENERQGRTKLDQTERTTQEQVYRWRTQNGVDIANAVTGGFKNVASGVESFAKAFTGGGNSSKTTASNYMLGLL